MSGRCERPHKTAGVRFCQRAERNNPWGFAPLSTNRMPPVSEEEEKRQRIVREAAKLMGHRELAGRLGTSMDDVSSWIDGTAPVPDAILIQLSEVLVSWSGKQRF